MDISESARVFAAVDLSVADANIASWDAKLHYHWWRPITAIQLANTDGNPNTTPRRGLGTLDRQPALPGLLERTQPRSWLPLGEPSPVCSGSDEERSTCSSRPPRRARPATTRSKSQLIHDAVDSRVWSGIHFRTADRVGAEIGKLVARRALSQFFQPTS